MNKDIKGNLGAKQLDEQSKLQGVNTTPDLEAPPIPGSSGDRTVHPTINSPYLSPREYLPGNDEITDLPRQKPLPRRRRKPERLFLGMTALQRFIAALFLLIVVLILGTFFLLLTDKIAMPFLFNLL